jgi:hypothetical protein
MWPSETTNVLGCGNYGWKGEGVRGSQCRKHVVIGVFVLFAACTTTHSQNIWVSLNKNWNNLRLKVIMAVWNLPWKCGLSFMNFCEFSSRNDTCKHKYSNHFTMSCSTSAFSGKIVHQCKLAEAPPSLMFNAWTPGAHSSRHFVYVHLIFIYVWSPYLPSLFKL